MKKLVIMGAAALVCGAVALLGPAWAQEEDEGCGCEACGCEGCGEGPGMEMPAWTQKTTEHEELKKLAGSWTTKSTMWMAPGAPGTESAGSAKGALILNGNFLEQHYQGTWEGMPFEGRLMLGYDTFDKEWVSIWVDSFAPVFSISKGKKEGDILVFKTFDPDWMGGTDKRVPGKLTVRWDNPNQYTLQMFAKHEGKEFKHMEMVYTRK